MHNRWRIRIVPATTTTARAMDDEECEQCDDQHTAPDNSAANHPLAAYLALPLKLALALALLKLLAASISPVISFRH
jgi:hypothetical protein